MSGIRIEEATSIAFGVEVERVFEPFETCENQRIEERAEKVIRTLWQTVDPK
jgi:hypothetical protein